MDILEQKVDSSQRVLSIDALRGFDMFWIVGGGAIFSSLHDIFDSPITEEIKNQLQHVPWEGFQFEDQIFGGAIPRQYIPAVEKGIVEAAEKGYLAGFPVVDFKGQARIGSGSSFAVPRLAAIALRILADDPDIATGALRDRLLARAIDPPGEAKIVSHGWIKNPLGD